MPDTKISALSAASALGGTEEIPGVQSAGNVKITPAQIKTYTSASPTLVTPALGVATATSLAIGGAALGSNALAVAGLSAFSSSLVVTQASANTGLLTSTGYSLTGSNATPAIDIAGTWNTSGTPDLIKVAVTNTASNSASNLLNFTVGGTTRAFIGIEGKLQLRHDNAQFLLAATGGSVAWFVTKDYMSYPTGFYAPTSGWDNPAGIRLPSGNAFAWSSNSTHTTAPDTILWRHAAGAVMQRNAANAQELLIAGTWTSATNFEAISLLAGAAYHKIAAKVGASGTLRPLVFSYHNSASDPTASDIPDGTAAVWKKTAEAIKLWGNSGGTLTAVALS